jgi:hypothetical protein
VLLRLGLVESTLQANSRILAGDMSVPKWWRMGPCSEMVFALHQATGKAARCDMAHANIVGKLSEQRDAAADQDWNTSDDQSLDEFCAKKPLNRQTTVNVCVTNATRIEFRRDLRWIS